MYGCTLGLYSPEHISFKRFGKFIQYYLIRNTFVIIRVVTNLNNLDTLDNLAIFISRRYTSDSTKLMMNDCDGLPKLQPQGLK